MGSWSQLFGQAHTDEMDQFGIHPIIVNIVGGPLDF